MTAQDVLDSNQRDEQINEVAEWLESLRFEQILFLKESYEAMIRERTKECGQEYEH
jgi:hypothetical protein